MQTLPKLILHPKKDRSPKLFHPWIFSGAVHKVEGNPVEGELVTVYSSSQEFLGIGHYHSGSIKVRLLTFENEKIDAEFWARKLNAALQVRKRLGLLNNPETNTFRLVHGEGDGLPGLIIDVYGEAAVVQAHTPGMLLHADVIGKALENLDGINFTTIYLKNPDAGGKVKAEPTESRHLKGSAVEAEVVENGVRFYVNWLEGQKTGFFLDQRENRKLLHRYAKGKNILNTFSYSGGFSMYGLKAGARLVHSIDSSKKAGEWAERNVLLNDGSERHQFFAIDAFDYLKSTDENYDLLVLDPPAFAKHLSATDNAIIGYRNLNLAGIRKIVPGGILFTFSCSQVIDKQLFRKIVFQAAAQSGRNVRILHQLSQGPDHPISLYHPEGEYLKGLVLMID